MTFCRKHAGAEYWREVTVVAGMDTDQLAAYRTNKDDFLATSPHSPLPAGKQEGFSGLRYYAPNPDLAFNLKVEPADGSRVQVQTSDGAVRDYERAGTVSFVVDGAAARLTLYDTGHDGLFVPFRDATSGHATYGAGRYLDLRPNSNGTVTLDFNLAYNPFCAYNTAYSCPLPPHENWLDVAIAAGELDFEA